MSQKPNSFSNSFKVRPELVPPYKSFVFLLAPFTRKIFAEFLLTFKSSYPIIIRIEHDKLDNCQLPGRYGVKHHNFNVDQTQTIMLFIVRLIQIFKSKCLPEKVF